jgi:hypothetical protein
MDLFMNIFQKKDTVGVDNSFNSLNLNDKGLKMTIQDLNNIINDVNYNSVNKSYVLNDDINEFNLQVCGMLSDKLNYIVDHFERYENISSVQTVEAVIKHGISRSQTMSHLGVRYYLYRLNEVEKCIEIFEDDLICVNHSNAFHIKYKNIVTGVNELTPVDEQIRICKYSLNDDEIKSFSLTLSDKMMNQFLFICQFWKEEYNFSLEKSAECAIEIGINRVYGMVMDGCDFSDLSTSDPFLYDCW